MPEPETKEPQAPKEPEAPPAKVEAKAPAKKVPADTDPKCTHCFDTKKILHGVEIPCPWCTDEGKAKYASVRGG
jgi:hypothetical protein